MVETRAWNVTKRPHRMGVIKDTGACPDDG